MIFELFITFTFLSLVFIGLGYAIDIKALSLFGFTTLFLLGLTVNLSGITIQSGQTESYSYMCYVCDGNSIPSLAGNSTEIASITTTYDYTALTDQASLWIGRWLMIISMLGFILVILSNRKGDY